MQVSLESKVAVVTRVNCAPLRRQAYILSCNQLHERSPSSVGMQSTAQAAANGLALIMGLLGCAYKLSHPTERVVSLWPCARGHGWLPKASARDALSLYSFAISSRRIRSS